MSSFCVRALLCLGLYLASLLIAAGLALRSALWSVSQTGQDQFVLDVLSGLGGGGAGGTFIDVGASDGLHNSNTAQLEWFHGWRGICVEPGPRRWLLGWLRPRCHAVLQPMSDEEGLEVRFQQSAVTAEHGGIVSSIGAGAGARQGERGASHDRMTATTLRAAARAMP